MPDPPLLSARLELALRRAAVWHAGQVRKRPRPTPDASGPVEPPIPYLEHLAGVALILQRAGFGDDVVIAGLLHDALEDTGADEAGIADEFGPDVLRWVLACTERKREPGADRDRPWEDRKREHLEHLRGAPREARAVALADKLHNLRSMEVDRECGEDVWSKFNAPAHRVIWYYRTMLEILPDGDDILRMIADECGEVLNRLAGSIVPPNARR